MEKKYLGDGVYVEVKAGMLVLTTEEGIKRTNQIFLDVEVMEELIAYYEDAKD